ncbi:kinesin-domain-containing protein [Peniophora sp. CONT]|nr:kinesin-domain-containing protein [Peniophora sp. CONT]
MSSNHKVKIAARLRPPLPGEQQDDGVYVKHEQPPRICVTHPRDPTKNMEYPLNSCYDHEATQEEIFVNDVQPLIEIVYSGSTVTVFAYGVTSSGKTHTMQGSSSQPGIIPRTVEAIFERSKSSDHKVAIEMSYFEIYKDECYDLLVPRDKAPKLPVREDAAGQVVVAGLEKVPLASNAEFARTYTAANEQRSVGATNLNRESSRSHAILTLEVKIHNVNETKLLTGKIHLVDLAGSENNKHTGNDAGRMQESKAINKSLSVLGQVVHALNRGDTRIPYRNAKLTRILQDALGGKSIGLLICNLAPGSRFRQDTFNTLNFATRTSIIENKPVIDEQDTKPPPKTHFAAPPPPANRLAPLPSLPASKSTAVLARPQTSRPRPSLSFSRVQTQPQPQAGPSRVPRKSHAGLSNPYPNAQARKSVGHSRATLAPVGEEDIDDKIAKAVEVEVAKRIEAEVAKRIAAFEKQRQDEDKERVANESADKASTTELSLTKDTSLPPDMLAPLLKRHEDLDAELRRRLEELETKYERNNSHAQAAQGLSPMSRKKTGRAYVALARAHSEKGDLQIALDLYRKAETYVPDNVKLKERILEIDWSVKNGRPFQPSPKRPRKTKTKKAKKIAHDEQLLAVELPAFATDSDHAPSAKGGDSDDENTVENILQPPDIIVQSAGGRVTRSMKARFGTEATNSPEKRSMDQNEEGEQAHTPPKRSRHAEGKAAPMPVTE